MKIGFRKPNIKKSIKARTTGKIKRKIKKMTNPLYGEKGMGYISNPKKAVYNKIYNKTSINAFDVFKKSKNSFYNIFVAFPLFFILLAIEIVYYCYKYLFIGITWIIKKVINAVKHEKEEGDIWKNGIYVLIAKRKNW